MSNESKLINASGLWKNKDKNGNIYLSGSLGGVRVLVFPVKNKTSEKSPDYTLCFAPNEQPASAQQPRKPEPEDF